MVSGGSTGKGQSRNRKAEQMVADAAWRRNPRSVGRKPLHGCSVVTVWGSLYVAEALPWGEVMEPVTWGSGTGDPGTNGRASKAS